ncbi:MAG: hypothetical protein ACI4SG_08715 [Oligosphaeraceae bacterium]
MPFWSWNDALAPEELCRQIRRMHEGGYGGFFMHARGGLGTPYMGDSYMACVEACVREASRLGMEAWLYDENGWPSGFGGGRVNGMGEEYQQKYLVAGDFSEGLWDSRGVGIYRRRDGARVTVEEARKAPGEHLLLRYEVNPCYVDLLDPRVTDAFLESTYGEYLRRLPEEVSRQVAGVFTDEPQLRIGKVFYSPWFYREFSRRHGVEIREELGKLFLEVPGAAAFRRRFYGEAGRCFSENYTRKLGEWCRRHGWGFTGHQVQEVDYAEQTLSSGAVSFHYPHYSMPGVDHLGTHEPYPFLVRQMTSVAAQTGQERRLVEMFACCGWDLSLEKMRWMYSLMQIYGINFLCNHLYAYSLKGLRKRDYPPSFGDHEPWFAQARALNDVFARGNQWLAEGEEMVDTLVLHAQTSAWCQYCQDDSAPAMRRLVEATETLMDILDRAQEPFHFGFEPHLAETGAVEGEWLRLGRRRYRRVILPGLTQLDSPTLKLLQDFPGELLRFGESTLAFVDGREATEEERRWFRNLPVFREPRGLLGCPEPLPELRVRGTAYANGCLLLLVNHGEETPLSGWITLKDAPDGLLPYWVEPQDASRRPASWRLAGGERQFRVSLPPGGTGWLWLEKVSGDSPEAPQENPAPARSLSLPSRGVFQVSENFLPLDLCRLSVEEGPWEEMPLSSVQWRLLQDDAAKRFRFQVSFTVQGELPGGLSLMTESPEQYQIRLNGKPLAWKDAGFRFDPSFRIAPLPREQVLQGENVLEFAGLFRQSPQVHRQLAQCHVFETAVNNLRFDQEIETPCLVGDFRVFFPQGREQEGERRVRMTGRPVLTPPDHTPAPLNLPEAGYPFFSGKGSAFATLALEQVPAGGVRLALHPRGLDCLEVLVNGTMVTPAPLWQRPWEVRVPEALLRPGENQVEVRFVASLRNLLGPHHASAEREETWGAGPGLFSSAPNPFNGFRTPEWLPGASVADCRLGAP